MNLGILNSKYYFAAIYPDKREIILFKKNAECGLHEGYFIKDASIVSHSPLTISGTRLNYKFLCFDIFDESKFSDFHESSYAHTKGFKIGRFQIIKPKKYVKGGWVRTSEKTDVTIHINNIIAIYDNEDSVIIQYGSSTNGISQ